MITTVRKKYPMPETRTIDYLDHVYSEPDSTLTYLAKNRRKVNPNKSYVTNGIGSIQEFLFDGQKYIVVGTCPEGYLVRCPDRTFGKVDARTKTFLGPY